MLRPRHGKRAAALALLALLAGTGVALAQSPLGIGSAEPGFGTSGGMFGSLFAWINAHQQAFYHALTGALKNMRENPWAASTLVGLSFAYGVFHAAGPGHGKAVISSYMLANEIELKRGVALSFISSMLQGIVAILLVGAGYLVLRGTAISMTDATRALETTSYALIAAFGAWLLYRKLWRSRSRRTAPVEAYAMALADTAGHGHHLHAHDTHGAPAHSHAHHQHGHHDGHPHAAGEVCATCGHAHAPDPELLKGDRFALSEAWSAIVAVGLRPCSGALIVLSFALLNGLYVGGLLSVIAMSIGTAITVSALATLAVTAKGVAMRLAGGDSAALRVGNAIEILGALLVMVLGLVLLGASLQG
ncbi:nickel/cobalt transporter [Rhizobium sp. TRM96647]|uniref:nickel/cobalt transporter n=1 Tax=unclassified Rhizobium TaxID=2613769 RepID=UPI0021E71C34|nr:MULTISPECIES: nickel/cobalt transporter [unclassified Rhizobium]MCV3736008.1 nickel/cobalt transporter [Rhizobium sp. TRM96647]MCV3758330.1 nickel/cobalt transporter [Rhizobium sp. TRM96650]